MIRGLALVLALAFPLSPLGFAQDNQEALRKTREAAERGDKESQCLFGVFYSEGPLVAQDYHEAAQWLRESAEQGYGNAQVFLATAYYFGRGVSQDYKEAVQWFRKAAALAARSTRTNRRRRRCQRSYTRRSCSKKPAGNFEEVIRPHTARSHNPDSGVRTTLRIQFLRAIAIAMVRRRGTPTTRQTTGRKVMYA